MLLTSNPRMEELFGVGGKSGILSQYAMEHDCGSVNVNESYGGLSYQYTNYLVCLIYGDLGYRNLSLTTNLKFTLVNGSQIFYDEECLSLGTPRIYSTHDEYSVSVDMSKPIDGRLTITGTILW